MMYVIGITLLVLACVVSFIAGVLAMYWATWSQWNEITVNTTDLDRALASLRCAGRTISTNPTVDTSDRDRAPQVTTERRIAEEEA